MHEKKPKKTDFLKKIEKLYQNYGIDPADMDEEELERLEKLYQQKGKDIDSDLKESEQHKNKFDDDIV